MSLSVHTFGFYLFALSTFMAYLLPKPPLLKYSSVIIKP